jgi:hypothetical protein
MSGEILTEWTPEPAFVPLLQLKTGSGSRSTLQRWRRLGTVPQIFEWTRVGRVVLWRERKESNAAGAKRTAANAAA